MQNKTGCLHNQGILRSVTFSYNDEMDLWSCSVRFSFKILKFKHLVIQTHSALSNAFW